MKTVISGDKLKKYMKESVNLLCDTVIASLGPLGNNVIIDSSLSTPYITNDGVTIANNIESDDKIINTILELTKASSVKADELVGDGTTSTLVLLKSIFNLGYDLIEKGKNKMVLKKEIDKSIEPIIKLILENSKKPNNKDILNVLNTSCDDDKISFLLINAHKKVKDFNAISIVEGTKEYDEVIYQKGYKINAALSNNLFLKDKSKLTIDNCKILLINNGLYNLEIISDVLNEIIKRNEKLIIIANEFSDEVINELLSLNIDNSVNVYPIKLNEYSNRYNIVYEDLSIVSNSKVIFNTDDINYSYSGLIKSIIIDKDDIFISFENNDNIKNKIKEIKKNIKKITNDLDKEYYNDRLLMLNKGKITIEIGGKTYIDIRHRTMRAIDALNSYKTALNGVIPGSGVILHKISNSKFNSDGMKILLESLKSILEQIIINTGDEKEILNKIIDSDYTLIYNFKNNNFEDINSTTILDPVETVINEFKIACSVAGMLLTTSSIVINENENKKIEF